MRLELRPTASERQLASICIWLSLFFPYLAPFVGLFWRRRSPFVAVHAAHALVETVLLNLALILGLAISFAYSVYQVWGIVQSGGATFEWSMVWMTLLRAGLTWLVIVVVGLVYAVLTIRQAIQAAHGQYHCSWIVGRIAARFCGISRQKIEATRTA